MKTFEEQLNKRGKKDKMKKKFKDWQLEGPCKSTHQPYCTNTETYKCTVQRKSAMWKKLYDLPLVMIIIKCSY